MKTTDFIIDFECLSTIPESIITEVSILPFVDDPHNPESFQDLIKKGKKFKLSVASQRGNRHMMSSTINWWKKQSPEARKNLAPHKDDITVPQAVDLMLDFFKQNNVDTWNSRLWCRGMSFDIPVFISMLQERFQVKDTQKLEPTAFWNGRDIRTAIEAASLTRGLTMTPLRKGLLDGFVMHDSIHDCAKDAIMLTYIKRYALGLENPPSGDDIDPQTVKKKM